MKKRIFGLFFVVCLCVGLINTVILKVEASSVSASTCNLGLSSPTSVDEIRSRIDTLQSNYYKNGDTWSGSYDSTGTCLAFSKKIFHEIFGCDMDNEWGRLVSGKNSTYRNNTDVIKSLSSGYSTSELKAMLYDNARIGDVFIGYSSTSNTYHMMIILSVGESGFYTYEGNGDGKNTVWYNHYRAYSDFRSKKPNGAWLLRYKNYPEYTHTYTRYYEAAHPHRVYMKCSCGDYYYTGEYEYVSGCSECIYPGKPTLNYSGSLIENGEDNIVFSWNVTPSTTHYNLCLYKLNENTYEWIETISYAESGIKRNLKLGSYKVLLQSVNSNVWLSEPIAGSSWPFTNADFVYFDITDGIYPQKPILSYSGSLLKNGNDNIKFSWNPTNNTTHYNLYLDKYNEGEYERIENISYAENGISKNLDVGKYRVLLESVNSKVWLSEPIAGSNWPFTQADWVYFEIKDGIYPGKPILNYSGSLLQNGADNIVFTWEPTDNATHYNLFLYEYRDGEYKWIETIFFAENGTKRNLEAGSYKVLLQAVNSNIWLAEPYAGSNWPFTDADYVFFSIDDPEKVEIENMNLQESTLMFTIQSYKSTSATAIIAYYTSTGQLLQCDTQEITLESGTKTIDTTPPTGYATLKIFLLGEGNLPLCEAYTQSVK